MRQPPNQERVPTPGSTAGPPAARLGCVESGLVVYWLTGIVALIGVLMGLDLLSASGHRPTPRHIPLSGDAMLDAVTQWDGQWYLKIAEDGYSYDPAQQSSIAFFPLYPLLTAGVARATTMPVEWAGLVVSHVCLAAAMILMALYVRQRYGEGADRLGPWVLLCFGLMPTTFFLRMTYSESTFLLLAILAMLGMERGWRPGVVAVVVGLATAARPVGVALLPPLAWYVWMESSAKPPGRDPLTPALSRRERGSRALRRLAWVMPLGCWGLLGFVAFQWAALDDPLAFVHAQSHWQDRPAVGWGEKAVALLTWEPVWSAYIPSWPGYCGRYAAELPGWVNLQLANPVWFVGAAILIVLGAAKRWLTMREVLLAAGLMLIPYVARGFDMCMASQGRFTAAVFPMYLVLGHVMSRAPLAVSAGVLALAAVYLAIYSALFAAGHLMI